MPARGGAIVLSGDDFKGAVGADAGGGEHDEKGAEELVAREAELRQHATQVAEEERPEGRRQDAAHHRRGEVREEGGEGGGAKVEAAAHQAAGEPAAVLRRRHPAAAHLAGVRQPLARRRES